MRYCNVCSVAGFTLKVISSTPLIRPGPHSLSTRRTWCVLPLCDRGSTPKCRCEMTVRTVPKRPRSQEATSWLVAEDHSPAHTRSDSSGEDFQSCQMVIRSCVCECVGVPGGSEWIIRYRDLCNEVVASSEYSALHVRYSKSTPQLIIPSDSAPPSPRTYQQMSCCGRDLDEVFAYDTVKVRCSANRLAQVNRGW